MREDDPRKYKNQIKKWDEFLHLRSVYKRSCRGWPVTHNFCGATSVALWNSGTALLGHRVPEEAPKEQLCGVCPWEEWVTI